MAFTAANTAVSFRVCVWGQECLPERRGHSPSTDLRLLRGGRCDLAGGERQGRAHSLWVRADKMTRAEKVLGSM